MSQLSIDLPVAIEDKVRARAAECGFASARDYVLALIDADTEAEDDGDQYPDSPCSFSTKEELEVMLIEGIESGPGREIMPEEWERMREDAKRRIAQKGLA